jgi:hypothetical protein
VPDHKRLHLDNFKLRQGFTVPQWVAMLNTRVFVLPLRAGGVLHHGRELGGLFSHRLSRRS